MATIKQQLTLEQLIAAIRQLPLEQKMKLRKIFEEETFAELERRFDEALAEIRAANPGLDEDEVMEEVNQEVHEIRAERLAKNRR